MNHFINELHNVSLISWLWLSLDFSTTVLWLTLEYFYIISTTAYLNGEVLFSRDHQKNINKMRKHLILNHKNHRKVFK